MEVAPVYSRDIEQASSPNPASREPLIHSRIQTLGEEQFPDDRVQWSMTRLHHSGSLSFAEVCSAPATTGYEKYVFVLRFEGGDSVSLLACYCWSETGWDLLTAVPGVGHEAIAKVEEKFDVIFSAGPAQEPSVREASVRVRRSRGAGLWFWRAFYAVFALVVVAGIVSIVMDGFVTIHEMSSTGRDRVGGTILATYRLDSWWEITIMTGFLVHLAVFMAAMAWDPESLTESRRWVRCVLYAMLALGTMAALVFWSYTRAGPF